MKKNLLHLKFLLTSLTLATLFTLVSANAQQSQSQGGSQTVAQDNDTTVRELASFDRFMDGHPEIAEQLRRDPSLVNNKEFVERHTALQEYLQQHPGVREEITENPNRFMHQERRFDRAEDRRDTDRRGERPDNDRRDADRRDNDRRDNDRRDNDTTRGEVAEFDRFMDGHPEIAEQLRKDPSLVKNQEYVEKHPELQEYLQQHPGVREEMSENPDRFMRQEQRFDRREDSRDTDQRGTGRDTDQRGTGRDNDTTRGELASFDRFSDSHPEIAEQLHKDPSLVNNREFVEKHPALQEYLQQHPGVREEITENPNRFMRQEQRFDRFEDRDHDMANGPRANFGEFLASHAGIAQQLSKDPGLANNKEFKETHPEFQQYLKTHPGVQEQLSQNPQMFMKSVQQFNTSPSAPSTPTTKTPNVEAVPKTPTIDPMPKP